MKNTHHIRPNILFFLNLKAVHTFRTGFFFFLMKCATMLIVHLDQSKFADSDAGGCLYRSDWGVIPASAFEIPCSPIPQLAHLDCAGSIASWEFWLSPTAGLSRYETENQTDNPMTQLLGCDPPSHPLPRSTSGAHSSLFCCSLLCPSPPPRRTTRTRLSLLNYSKLMNGATLWLHQPSFSGRGSAHGWRTDSERGGEEEGESQADHS